jgi:hypothetical protein
MRQNDFSVANSREKNLINSESADMLGLAKQIAIELPGFARLAIARCRVAKPRTFLGQVAVAWSRQREDREATRLPGRCEMEI